MKNKLILTLSILSLALISPSVRAQTSGTNNSAAPVATPVGTFELALPVLSATNIEFVPYATYAPQAPTKAGGGGLVIYDVTKNVGGAVGLDWLGNFNLFSGNATFKVPWRPFADTNIVITPNAIAGIASPFSGAGKQNGSAATIAGVGGSITLGQYNGWHFNLGAEYINWTSSGAYSGNHYEGFLGITKGF